jgi:YesN/AraC family two-component response regulator
VVLIGPDSVHKTASVENKPHARYVINFNGEYLKDLSKAFDGINLLECFNHGADVLQLSLLRQQAIEMMLSLLWESRESESPKDVAARKLRLAELLLYLDECATESHMKNSGKMVNSIVECAQSYISAHYTDDLSLSEIARQAYVSDHYLSRLFKKTTGLSVVEYINSLRLTSAKQMLEDSSTRISRIGEMVGFGTLTHFSRVFKKATGLPPQQYRKLYHSGEKT